MPNFDEGGINGEGDVMVKEELKRLKIGEKIKRLREEKGFELEELAERLKIQAVILSQIEQEVIPPTVATIVNLSRMFEISPDYFLGEEAQIEGFEVVRADERRKIEDNRHVDSALNYSYESLAHRLEGKSMEPFLVEAELTEEEPELLSHEGEEFWYVLEGEVEFTTKEERVNLKEGDSIYFISSTPHGLKGVGGTKPKILAVVLPERKG